MPYVLGSWGGSSAPSGGVVVLRAAGCIIIVASPEGSSGATPRGEITVGIAPEAGGGNGTCGIGGVCGAWGTGGAWYDGGTAGSGIGVDDCIGCGVGIPVGEGGGACVPYPLG